MRLATGTNGCNVGGISMIWKMRKKYCASDDKKIKVVKPGW